MRFRPIRTVTTVVGLIVLVVVLTGAAVGFAVRGPSLLGAREDADGSDVHLSGRSPAGLVPPGSVAGVLEAGGQRQYIDCRGSGGPTLVLVSGVTGSSKDWEPVIDRLRASARVCTYDRPGLGNSPARTGPAAVDAGVHATELLALLKAAGEPGPYLLVGHSYGGLIVRALQHAHPDLVAGMVLLDPVPPDFWTVYPPFGTVRHEGGTTLDYVRSAAATGGDPALADVPLVMLAAGVPLARNDTQAGRQDWLAAQRHTAQASRDSLDLVAPKGQHQLQEYAPDGVVAAIETMQQAVRTHAPLPACDPATWARVGVRCAGS